MLLFNRLFFREHCPTMRVCFWPTCYSWKNWLFPYAKGWDEDLYGVKSLFLWSSKQLMNILAQINSMRRGATLACPRRESITYRSHAVKYSDPVGASPTVWLQFSCRLARKSDANHTGDSSAGGQSWGCQGGGSLLLYFIFFFGVTSHLATRFPLTFKWEICRCESELWKCSLSLYH